MKYTEHIKWGDHLGGVPNVYTYTGETGVVYVKTEKKNVVTDTFSTTVTATMPGQKPKRVPQYVLKGFLDRGEHVAELPGKQQDKA